MSGGADRATLLSESEAQTESLAGAIGAMLRAGDLVALEGELGAGKTRFVRGLVIGLGGEPRGVSSPTFTLMNEYEPAEGRPALLHIDAYRMSGAGELETLGVDLRALPDAACAIEWADRLGDAMPGDHLRVGLQHAGQSERLLTLSWDGAPSWRERGDALRGAIESRRAAEKGARG